MSVVIPCYNQAKYIRACIESVIKQGPHVEVVVVDDGSTDGSGGIIQEFSPALRFVTQANGGPSAARNAGFAVSRGNLVCFLDGDDLLCPGFAEAILACARESPEADVLVSAWRVLGTDGALSGFLAPPVTNEDAFHSWLRRGWGPPMCFTVRREMLNAVGPFDPDRAVVGNEDWDMWLRIAGAGARFKLCPGAEAVYRMTTGSVSSNALRQWGSRREVLAKALELHPGCWKCRRAVAANGPDYLEHVILPRVADQSLVGLISLALKAPTMAAPLARVGARRFAMRSRIALGRLRRRLGPGG
ncbi:MAG: glycosyltransferase family 2 protein [Fimbriimonadaceae bacterium]